MIAIQQRPHGLVLDHGLVVRNLCFISFWHFRSRGFFKREARCWLHMQHTVLCRWAKIRHNPQKGHHLSPQTWQYCSLKTSELISLSILVFSMFAFCPFVLQHCWPPPVLPLDNSFYDDSFHATYLPRFSHSASQINHSLEEVAHQSPWHSIKALMGPYCSSQEMVVDQRLETHLLECSQVSHAIQTRDRDRPKK